ncbi:RICIN domain-containing protein [Streptomyces sp. NBC_01538]|uniref:RICIN domain-containing protein n=1 Tax=Streptomyces sp. NBC_01538 TaxID=2903897 RepID=UPI00386CFFD1
MWRLEPVAGGNGDRYAVRNGNSQKCLAVPGAVVEDGTQALQWPCRTGDEQRWIW